MKLFRQFLTNPWKPVFVVPLIVINFLGSIYGYYWYSGQLAATPVKWWLFVADSPFASTLFTIFLLLGLLSIKNRLFQVIACTAVIKYGLWATLLIFHFWFSGGKVELTELMLVASHLGMALEGLIYLRKVRFYFWVIPVALAWMGWNDYLDYGLGIHPYLFLPAQLLFAQYLTLGLTAAIILTLFIHCKVKPPSIFTD